MSASEGYDLVRRIGTGAGGTVYLAKKATGDVAIRQFESKAVSGSQTWRDDRHQFIQAGKQSRGLTNPRIVPVLEVIDEAGEAFVVMEYMTAPTLAAALSADQRFTPKDADTILCQIAAALDFAHGRGVVHGDLKPSDVFLPQKGAMVSDFGISPRARLNFQGPIDADLVHGYLSPEHLRDADSIGPRSDQYSLAVIAYQMYTGRLPYGGNVIDLPQAILNTPIVPPSQVDPQLPAGIDAPLLKALSRDPNQRHASCTELVALLGASLITRPEAGRSSSKKLAYALVPVLLLLLLGLMWLTRKRPTEIATNNKFTGMTSTTPPQAAHNPSSTTGPTAGKLTGGKTAKKTAAKPTISADPPPRKLTSPPENPLGPNPTSSRLAEDRDPHFSIDVLSRGTHQIENGSSFPLLDPQLGELALGDLAALVSFEGQRLPRGRLRLEWVLDRTLADSKPVVLKPGRGAMVFYGNEPSAGDYRLNLKLDKQTIQSFTFRITKGK